MQRRQFLGSAGALAGIAAVPLAHALSASTPDPRFVLLRAQHASRGAAFLPLSRSPCGHCASSALQVSIDGLQAAGGRSAFDDLAIHAMFDLPDGSSVPFVAWRYAAGTVPSRTDHARFIAGRETVRRLEIEYRLAADGVRHREHCPFARFDAPLLAPGHYVLLGPRADGSPVQPRGFVHSGEVSAPLSVPGGRDFDYLAIRVEPLA